jgi:magnesium-transporting ATPase (P-type)
MEKFIEISQKSEEEVLKELKTSKEGLDENEVKERLEIYGLNNIVSFKIDLLEIIKRNSLNFFNIFLFFAGFLSFLIKGPEIETILIFFFLFLSIFIAVLQDYRINKLSEKLLSYFENYAYVKRQGKWQKINAKEIVPGDCIKVSAGYLIPADLRILKAEDALVDESIITGESEPVFKNSRINTDTERINTDYLKIDSDFKRINTDKNNTRRSVSNPRRSVIPENIALMGTTLIKGEIEGIVFATGKKSYFGSVAKKTLEIEKETAYQKMMSDFAKNIAFLSIFIALAVIFINLLKPGYPNIQELIIFAIVLAVAIVPEFLPTMTVLALSLAGNRLAKRGLVIKRLSAIEDLGAIEILCTDKTGTITTNELKLERIITRTDADFKTKKDKKSESSVLGPKKSVSEEEFIKYFLADYYLTEEITPYEKAILNSRINTNNTYPNKQPNNIPEYKPNNNIYPNDNRIFGPNSGNKFGSDSGNEFELIEDIDFDPIKRIRKIIVKENGKEIEIIKGAPENVLNYIFYPNEGPNNDIYPNKQPNNIPEYKPNENQKFGPNSGNKFSQDSGNKNIFGQHSGNEFGPDSGSKDYNYWLKIFEDEDKNGFRTLALGIKTNEESKFLGIASFFDPLKETTFSAIQLAKSLNLEIKILTGDSLEVARKTALDLGLIEKDEKVVLGEEIRNLSEDEAKKIIKEAKVFARVLPEDKLKIIEILQKEKFVGFLGEGINDAPALKIANVALAVDNASDVVKQEADIILKEKDLKTIVEGIYSGRKVLENIGKYIKHTMSDNFGNLTSVAILSSILPYVPMTPLQVLLTNFLTDIPLVAFAYDNVNIKEIKKPLKMSGKHLVFLLLALGIIAGLANVFGYLIVRKESVEVIRTYIFFITTITGLLVSFLIRTKDWFFLSQPSRSFVIASILGFLLTLILVFLSPFKNIFSFSSLNLKLLTYAFLLMFIFVVGTELVKKLFYKKFPDVI